MTTIRSEHIKYVGLITSDANCRLLREDWTISQFYVDRIVLCFHLVVIWAMLDIECRFESGIDKSNMAPLDPLQIRPHSPPNDNSSKRNRRREELILF